MFGHHICVKFIEKYSLYYSTLGLHGTIDKLVQCIWKELCDATLNLYLSLLGDSAYS